MSASRRGAVLALFALFAGCTSRPAPSSSERMPVDDSIEARYAHILRDQPLNEAACLAWIRGVPPDEVLRRLGGSEPFEARTLDQIDVMAGNLSRAGGEPFGGAVGSLGEWTLLVEPNGWTATVAGEVLALSKGTEVISVFWNINALAEVSVVRDGQTVAQVHEVLDYIKGKDDRPRSSLANVHGTDPATVSELVADLAKVEGYAWRPAVLAWVERRTGARLPQGWLREAHPSAVFDKPRPRR